MGLKNLFNKRPPKPEADSDAEPESKVEGKPKPEEVMETIKTALAEKLGLSGADVEIGEIDLKTGKGLDGLAKALKRGKVEFGSLEDLLGGVKGGGRLRDRTLKGVLDQINDTLAKRPRKTDDHDLIPIPADPSKASFIESMNQTHTQGHLLLFKLFDCLEGVKLMTEVLLHTQPPPAKRELKEFIDFAEAVGLTCYTVSGSLTMLCKMAETLKDHGVPMRDGSTLTVN